jgi:hypothetical protein
MDPTFLSLYKTTTDAFTATELAIITNDMSFFAMVSSKFESSEAIRV